METQVKICGLRTPETVAAAVDAGADYLGFVFFPKSPRHVEIAQAAALAEAVRGKVKIVALTVDADDLLLDTLIAELMPDVVQLHGHETVERVKELAQRLPVAIWKALPVSTQEDVAAAHAYLPAVEKVLFDARPPKNATRPGGNAQSFDWALLEGLDRAIPFVLSGGLTVENVGKAVQQTHAACVDVSSGVEIAAGQKDSALIAAFVNAAKKRNG